MAESNAAEAPTANRIQLRYKLLAYLAIWIVALLLTAPGMWPLAYMFPLGLVAVFNRHLANDGGWGHLYWLLRRLHRSRIFLFPFKNDNADADSLRNFDCAT